MKINKIKSRNLLLLKDEKVEVHYIPNVNLKGTNTPN